MRMLANVNVWMLFSFPLLLLLLLLSSLAGSTTQTSKYTHRHMQSGTFIAVNLHMDTHTDRRKVISDQCGQWLHDEAGQINWPFAEAQLSSLFYLSMMSVTPTRNGQQKSTFLPPHQLHHLE